jgi:hypothetical protein
MILAQGPRSGDPLTIRRDARGRNARGDGGTDAPAEAMDGGTDAPAEAIRRTFHAHKGGILGHWGDTRQHYKMRMPNTPRPSHAPRLESSHLELVPILTMRMPTRLSPHTRLV